MLRTCLGITFLISAAIIAAGENAVASPDGAGWDGAGWYISSNAPDRDGLYRAQGNILFNGPIDQERDCMAVYVKLYSPIGGCHYFRSKSNDHVG